MSLAYDPVLELQKCGYTEREAAFLCMVGMHSGYFLRRQFLHFLQRKDGAMVQAFLQRAVALEHVRAIEYAQGRHIYHLFARPVYRTIALEDSQSRRTKGDREIKSRLMQLDYVLDHLGDRFLETGDAKLEYFRDKLGVSESILPYVLRPQDRVGYFPCRFPIATGKPSSDVPSFTYIDDGQRTVSQFDRWLGEHEQLLNSLRYAEVVYIADTTRNFADADRRFLRHVALQNARSLKIRGYLLERDYPIWSMKYRRAVL